MNCIRCGARFEIKKDTDGTLHAVALTREESIQEEYKEKETVLLVEDDKVARAMVESSLSDTDIRLLAVKNSSEALEALKNQKVDLIVTDLYLKNPDDPQSVMDGEELLRTMVEQGINIPAIITTGKEIIDDIVLDPKWFNLHVKGFIQKGNPFWPEELRAKIKEVLEKE